MGDGFQDAVMALDDRQFGGLQYFLYERVRDAFQDLPKGYVFNDAEEPVFKGAVNKHDIEKYLQDFYYDEDIPPANGLAQMLGALHEIGAVEHGGRTRNTRRYTVHGFDRKDAEDVVAAIHYRLDHPADVGERPGEQLLTYMAEFDGPVTIEDLQDTVEEEVLASRIGSVIGGLVQAGRLQRSGDGYTVA